MPIRKWSNASSENAVQQKEYKFRSGISRDRSSSKTGGAAITKISPLEALEKKIAIQEEFQEVEQRVQATLEKFEEYDSRNYFAKIEEDALREELSRGKKIAYKDEVE